MNRVMVFVVSLLLITPLIALVSCKKEGERVEGEVETQKKPEGVVTEEAAEQNAVKEVANKFFDATKSNDLELYKSIVTSSDAEKIGPSTEKTLAKYENDYKDLNYEITRVTVTGDRATVGIKINYVTSDESATEGSTDDEMEFVKEDGEWRLVAPF